MSQKSFIKIEKITKPQLKWIPAIDGLRAVAIAAVMVHHADAAAFEGWALGNVGVAVFFSISGFLAYYVLRRDEEQLGQVDYNYFLLRRILRIWPAYFAIITVAYLTDPDHRGITQLITFTTNWDMALFRPWSSLPHLWSIAVEEQFYVLAPFIYRAMRSKHRTSFCVAVLLLCNVLRVSYTFFQSHPSGNGGLYYMTYTYADLFLVGAMVAQKFTDGWTPRLATQLACLAASAIAFPIITKLWASALFAPYPWFAPLSYALPAPACVLLLVGVLPVRQTIFSWVLSLPLMRYVGRLSYSLYLVHLYVLYTFIALSNFLERGEVLQYYVAYFSICFAAAQVSYHGVEQWFLKLKNRNIQPNFIRYPWPAILTWMLIISGIIRLCFFTIRA